MKTWTYKTVGRLQIRADVYRADDAQPRPVLVWLHGGALMMGSKKDVAPDLMELCRTEGYLSGLGRLPAGAAGQAAADHRGPAGLHEVGQRERAGAVSRGREPGRGGRRVGRRISDHDDRDPRAAPQGPGVLLRLRRRGRPLVHDAFGVLPQAAAGLEGGCLQGNDAGGGDRACRRPVSTAAGCISISARTACGRRR